MTETQLANLFAQLSEEQTLLVDIVAKSFLWEGGWPIWQHVERRLDDSGLDLHTVLQSLPVIGGRGLGPRCELVWYDHMGRGAESPVRLLLAAGLHHQEYGTSVARPLVRVIKWFVNCYLAAPLSPRKALEVQVTSEGLHQEMPYLNEHLLREIPELIRYEPLGLIGSSSSGEGSWTVSLQRALMKYKGIDTLEAYVCREIELVGEALSQQPLVVPVSPALVSSASEAGAYVHSDLLADLDAVKTETVYSLDKLLGLLRELDDNFRRGNPYACHALLRAVLDHIPPLLGHQDFAQVAANMSMARTDKKYLQKLVEFKDQGDDVLHRQISSRRDVITMDDVPPRAQLNALLHLVLSALS